MIFDPVGMMNLFLGNKKKEITKDNEKYQELVEKVKLAYPVTYAEKTIVPTLCLYTGKDIVIRVRHYTYLKSKFGAKDKLDHLYCPSLPHKIYVKDSNETLKCLTNLNTRIVNFSNKYFSQNKK